MKRPAVKKNRGGCPMTISDLPHSHGVPITLRVPEHHSAMLFFVPPFMLLCSRLPPPLFPRFSLLTSQLLTSHFSLPSFLPLASSPHLFLYSFLIRLYIRIYHSLILSNSKYHEWDQLWLEAKKKKTFF